MILPWHDIGLVKIGGLLKMPPSRLRQLRTPPAAYFSHTAASGRVRRGRQRIKAQHGGQRRHLYPLPLPARRDRLIGADWTPGCH